MKIPPPVHGNQPRRPKAVTRFCTRFAKALACLCLGLGLLLPGMKSTRLNGRPVPRGQLHADLRTLVATVRYLVQPATDVRMNPAPFTERSPSLVQGTNNRPFEMFTGFSNQLWRCDCSSNSPV